MTNRLVREPRTDTEAQTRSSLADSCTSDLLCPRTAMVGGSSRPHARCSRPALAYFAPAIIQTLGHGSIRTQLLSVPPWACAFALAMLVAVLSDHVRHRFVFVLVPTAIALAGFAILVAVHDNKHLQYAALFLAAMGTYTAMPMMVCWFNTNRESRAALGRGCEER